MLGDAVCWGSSECSSGSVDHGCWFQCDGSGVGVGGARRGGGGGVRGVMDGVVVWEGIEENGVVDVRGGMGMCVRVWW